MKTLFPISDIAVHEKVLTPDKTTPKQVSGPSRTYCKKCGTERTIGLPCPICDPSQDWPDPIKPATNWNATRPEDIDSPLRDMDHVAAIIEQVRKIEEADDAMIKIGNRLDRLIDKLTNPELMADIPADDPRRIEAEDRRDELETKYANLRTEVVQAAALISAHAVYVLNDHVGAQWDSVLEAISEIVMERVRSDVSGILTSEAWQCIAVSYPPAAVTPGARR